MSFARVLEPEILDLLAADDPSARRSRHDLMRINFMMNQRAIMVRALRALPRAPRRIADLGSGDGRFLLSVAQRMAGHWPGVTAIVVDRQNIVSKETRSGFQALGWRCETAAGDVFDRLRELDAEVITANLFLHHFDDAALVRLLALVQERACALVASEPRRSRPALIASRMVFALACNHVTRNDAVASVRAGFKDRELSALWPDAPRWQTREETALPFTHLFTAWRDDV